MSAAWMTTIGGQDYHLETPSAMLPSNDMTILDIAHALALINRFTGHTIRPYSVAEHSLLVSTIIKAQGLPACAQLAALMHDAHEAIVGDMATPSKHVLGTVWMAHESLHATLVREWFGLKSSWAAWRTQIRAADLRALATERRDLTAYDPEHNLPWPILDTPGAEVQPLTSVDLMSEPRRSMTWAQHREAFITRFCELDAITRTSSPTTITEPAA